MSKKFSIIKTMDLDKLYEEIGVYNCKYVNEPYIFANDKTIDAIVAEMFSKVTVYERVSTSARDKTASPRCKCYGCKVFADNTLEFGEIELR